MYLKITGHFWIIAILLTDNFYESPFLKEAPRHLEGEEDLRAFYFSSPDVGKKLASRPGPFKLWKWDTGTL
jgi:hypothetical protein